MSALFRPPALRSARRELFEMLEMAESAEARKRHQKFDLLAAVRKMKQALVRRGI